MSRKLPRKISEQIDALAEEGNRLLKDRQFDAARKKFSDGFRLIPEPKTEWEASMWFAASIGDVLFQQGNHALSQAAFEDAVQLPGGLGNPFIHLRLGQLAFERGDRDRAADELARAYMGAGREIFEQQDPKYFALVEKVLKPPEGHERLP